MDANIFLGDSQILESNIESCTTSASNSLISSALEADTITLDLDVGRDVTGAFIPLGSSGLKPKNGGRFNCYIRKKLDIGKFVPGTELTVKKAGRIYQKFTVRQKNRIGTTRYRIHGASAILKLAKTKNYGGMFLEVPAETVIYGILQGLVDYEVDPAVGALTVTGYLPVATARDNLQQVLFATGADVTATGDGTLRIYARSDSVVSSFGASSCFIGGSVEEGEPIAGINLTEHNYTPISETVTAFSGSIDGDIEIKFQEPLHSLECQGGEILQSNANYAWIQASGVVTLTGKKYDHVTRIVTLGDTLGEGQSIDNATLVNPQISQDVAERVFKFLSYRTVIGQDVLIHNERPGDVVRVVNPYTLEPETASVMALDTRFSGIDSAAGVFLVGYTPAGVISGYRNYKVLTGSGTWTVPSGVGSTIRIILIGGGDGGNGGLVAADGTTGGDGPNDYRSEASAGFGGFGGEGGIPGAGGKIYEVTVKLGKTKSYKYSAGTGGTGGNKGNWQTNAGPGHPGKPSTFGAYSSAKGKVYPDGFREIKTGKIYGKNGTAGTHGADGGDGGAYQQGNSYIYGSNGQNAGKYTGGAGARGAEKTISEHGDSLRGRTGGGGGGGASYGGNGSAGSAGTVNSTVSEVLGGKGGNGANGGNGAGGQNYGDGGSGGHGGGGGGGGGAAFRRSFGEYSAGVAGGGRGGMGGAGGNGGNGASGCIIIYY